MIAGFFHEGSGLGNQLFRYITTRTLAEDKGCEWAMLNNENFKGSGFMKINLQGLDRAVFPMNRFEEKKILENGIDIRGYDPEINFVQDNTVIDGEFQDERYWGHKLPEIANWLAVERLDVPDDTCLIGFRGGEYRAVSELFLPKSFYFKGVEIMKQRGITKFEVHTDDPITAREFFPDFPIVDTQILAHSRHSNMGYNWRAMRYAKHAIIANSSFYIIPRLLAHQDQPDAVTLAPRYWARHISGVWALPQNYYKKFTYIQDTSTE